MDNNYRAHIEFNNLISLFKKIYNGEIHDFTEKNKLSMISNNYNDEVYPENYGGAYYDPKTEKLIICLTSKADYDHYNCFTDNSIVEYREVTYSLTELLNIMKIIDEVMLEYRIKQVCLSQKDQSILVNGDKNFDKSGLSIFLEGKNVDLSCLVFSDDIIETEFTTSTVPAGDFVVMRLNPSSTPAYASTICCNAYQYSNGTTKYGVITAGHLYKPNYNYYTSGGAFICSYNQVTRYLGGCRDVAFLPYQNQSDYSSTTAYINSTIPYGNKKIGNIDSLQPTYSGLEGTSVKKYGKATGEQSGTIDNVYMNLIHDSYHFSDLMKFSINQQYGDSGCPIGVEMGSTPNKQLALLGLVTIANVGHTIAYGTKATNVNGYVAFIEY